jgi:steroid delta-isomerase-like uncharacterized protein
MQQAPHDLIKKYYDAFNKADMTTFLSLLSEDVVHDINQGGSEQGKQAFAKFMDVMLKHYDEKVSELVIMVNADGTRAAAEFIINGKYLESAAGLPPAYGQTYRLPVGAFFVITDGKISRVTNYYNLQDWIKQVS